MVGAPNRVDRARLYGLLDDVFDRNRLTNNGPLVRELERRLSALLGVGNVVAVANGTLGLLLGAVALDVTGRVLVPSWTFAGTVQPLLWAGLTPEFVDVDPATHSMDPRQLERFADHDDIAAVVPVHLWGRPCAIEEIGIAAEELGVPVLYDAAHAIGSSHRGRAVGGFGAAEVLSFHATKWFSSIEGGALTTDDDELADRLRQLRNFGFAGEGIIPVNGINAKMSEIHAAVALTQLERFDELRAANAQRHRAYAHWFEGHDRIRLLDTTNEGTSGNGYAVVQLRDLGPAPAPRLKRVLAAENVQTRCYFDPGVHRLDAFARFAPDRGRLPITEALCGHCLALPTGEGVSVEDVGAIAGLVIEGIDRLSERHVEQALEQVAT